MNGTPFTLAHTGICNLRTSAPQARLSVFRPKRSMPNPLLQGTWADWTVQFSLLNFFKIIPQVRKWACWCCRHKARFSEQLQPPWFLFCVYSDRSAYLLGVWSPSIVLFFSYACQLRYFLFGQIRHCLCWTWDMWMAYTGITYRKACLYVSA